MTSLLDHIHIFCFRFLMAHHPWNKTTGPVLKISIKGHHLRFITIYMWTSWVLLYKVMCSPCPCLISGKLQIRFTKGWNIIVTMWQVIFHDMGELYMVWFIVYIRVKAKSHVFPKVPNRKQKRTLIWLPSIVTVVIHGDTVWNVTAQKEACALQLAKDVVSLWYPSYTFYKFLLLS